MRSPLFTEPLKLYCMFPFCVSNNSRPLKFIGSPAASILFETGLSETVKFPLPDKPNLFISKGASITGEVPV